MSPFRGILGCSGGHPVTWFGVAGADERGVRDRTAESREERVDRGRSVSYVRNGASAWASAAVSTFYSLLSTALLKEPTWWALSMEAAGIEPPSRDLAVRRRREKLEQIR